MNLTLLIKIPLRIIRSDNNINKYVINKIRLQKYIFRGTT